MCFSRVVTKFWVRPRLFKDKEQISGEFWVGKFSRFFSDETTSPRTFKGKLLVVGRRRERVGKGKWVRREVKRASKRLVILASFPKIWKIYDATSMGGFAIYGKREKVERNILLSLRKRWRRGEKYPFTGPI